MTKTPSGSRPGRAACPLPRQARAGDPVRRTAPDARHGAEANAFALELLIPTLFIRMDLEKLGGVDIDDERAIEKLAKRYRVSRTLMAVRLGQLIL